MENVKVFLRNNYKIIIIATFVLILSLILLISNLNKPKDLQEFGKVKYNYFPLISKEDLVGVVDRKGKDIIECKYLDIYIPNPALDVFVCFETEDEYEFLNSKGEKIFKDYNNVSALKVSDYSREFEKNVLKYEKNGKYGLIDFKGNKITNAEYDSIQSLKNKPGELLVKKNRKYGVIRIDGEIKIEIEYDNIVGDGFFNEKEGYKKTGYIVSKNTKEGRLYGYINYQGKKFVEPKYESLVRINEYQGEDVFLVEMQNGKKGVIKNKKQLIEQKYQSILYSQESNLFAVRRNANYGIYNLEGKEILPVKYEAYSFAGDYISVQKNEKKELFDNNGNKVSNLNYESVQGTGISGCYIVEKPNGYFSIITRDNVIEGNYKTIVYAYNNFFIFSNDEGFYGVLDLYAGEIVAPKYKTINLIEGVKALEAVTQTDEVDIYSENIEKTGTIKNAIIQNVGEKYVAVYSKEDKMFIDENGEKIETIRALKNKKMYSYKDGDKWGFIDKNKNIVIPAQYDIVTELNDLGFAGVLKNDKWGVIDENGKTIVEPTYEIKDAYYYPVFVGKYLLVLGDNYYCQEIN